MCEENCPSLLSKKVVQPIVPSNIYFVLLSIPSYCTMNRKRYWLEQISLCETGTVWSNSWCCFNNWGNWFCYNTIFQINQRMAPQNSIPPWTENSRSNVNCSSSQGSSKRQLNRATAPGDSNKEEKTSWYTEGY